MKLQRRASAIMLVIMLLIVNVVTIQAQAKESTYKVDDVNKGIVIIHTNDVHCGVDEDNPKGTFGVADVASYRQKLESEGYRTILVDAGDFIQGDILGTISQGAYPATIMNAMKYDIAVPGNHEFDYGMNTFLNVVTKANATYLSCNFMDLRTNQPVMKDAYEIIEKDGVKIGFVGITTPKTVTSSTPAYFKDEAGNWIYGFSEGNNGQDLFDKVQESVNAAKTAGADIVVAVGHMGVGEDLERWTSENVIQNTTGIDVFIDGHSHSVVTDRTVTDKSGHSVILAQTGTKLATIGTVLIDTANQNNLSAKLITPEEYTVTTDKSSEEYKEHKNISDIVTGIEKQNEELLSKVVAKSTVGLYANDPVTGNRLIRMQETNLGDLCADAYRLVSGADIGLINGGGIRADINAGNITYKDIISVHPYGNTLCVASLKGQQILDALEWSVSALPEESGRFLHISGITYDVQTYKESSVEKNDKGEFVSVNGEYRVNNVKVGGVSLDVNKEYTVASHNYYIKNGGDGYTMFQSAPLLQDEVMIDNQMLIKYIEDYLGGTIDEQYAGVNGQNRMHIVAEKPTEPETEKETTAETTSDNTSIENAVATGDVRASDIYVLMAMAGLSIMTAMQCMNKKAKE